jgi:beta-glucoside operon transcriptional antiterminator
MTGRDEGAGAVHAHKVLNNNVVVSVDSSGRERVLMGRGLGFQLKPHERIDLDRVEKTFILDEGADGDHAQRLLADVPYPVVEAVTTAVELAERTLERDLGRRLLIAVIDHVQFVLERLEKGIRIPATAMPELRVLHPREFAAGEAMVRSISRDLGTPLPGEESVFLTMHLLNATRDDPNGTAAVLFRRVQHVVETVEHGLGVKLDTASPDYARFILHVQFLLQRLVSRSMLRSNDTSFFEFARRSYPRSYAIAEQVSAYVKAATQATLTDEELLYVIVHVERLANQLEEHPPGDAVIR